MRQTAINGTMVTMSAKKQNNFVEALHNAATGYTVVVLSVVCFLLALVVVIAGVRVVIGTGLMQTAATTQATAVANGKS